MHAENGVIRSKTLTKMSDHDQLATDREVQNFKAALRVRFQLKILIPGPGRVGPSDQGGLSRSLNIPDGSLKMKRTISESLIIRRTSFARWKRMGNYGYR